MSSISLVPGNISFSLPDSPSTTVWLAAAQRKHGSSETMFYLVGLPLGWSFVEGIYLPKVVSLRAFPFTKL